MRRSFLLPAIAIGAATLVPSPGPASHRSIQRVSVPAPGGAEDGLFGSRGVAVSSDGRIVAFTSDHALTPDDLDHARDVYVHDRVAGTTELVSVWPDELGWIEYSITPRALSADGRWVAFTYSGDVFEPEPARVLLRDRLRETTVEVARGMGDEPANGSSYGASISEDGRFVAFLSEASNLVAGDLADHVDAFVADMAHGTTSRVSVRASGKEYQRDVWDATLSGDGRVVAYTVGASDEVWVRDLQSSAQHLLPSFLDPDTQSWSIGGFDITLSRDGRRLAFSAIVQSLRYDYALETLMFDSDSGIVRLLSRTPSGGRSNGHSTRPVISADGRWVGFWSIAGDLVEGDLNAASDTFLVQVDTGIVRLISVSETGGPAAGTNVGLLAAAFVVTGSTGVSADGAVVAFDSPVTGMTLDDRNATSDVFVHERVGGCGAESPHGPVGRVADRSSDRVDHDDVTALACTIARAP